MTENFPDKVPLAWAIEALKQIQQITQDGGNLHEAMQSCLAVAQSNLVSAIDRRVRLVNLLTGGTFTGRGGLIGLAEGKIAQWKAQLEQLEDIVKNVKDSTYQVMEHAGLKSVDGVEGGFRIQKSADTVEVTIKTYKKTYTNLLSADELKKHNIPAKYLQVIPSQIALNKEEITKDVLAGEFLPFAVKCEHEHIRMK